MMDVQPYQHADALNVGWLQVDDIHSLYFEQYGKPDGKPVIFLHGGPGAGTSKRNTAYFDPSVYHVVLLDQRGAGKSTPRGELRQNTTQLLVQDIETLRKHLGVPKWHMVFGGSWGVALGLAYAETYPEAVGSMVLRGVYLGQMGFHAVQEFFPDENERFMAHLTPEEQADHYEAYTQRLTSSDRSVRVEAAKAWDRLGSCCSSLVVDEASLDEPQDEDELVARSSICAYYCTKNNWLEPDQLTKAENIRKIQHIPTTIIQGRYDEICAPEFAWKLHRLLPKSNMYFVRDAGHSAGEAGIRKKLMEVCNDYAKESF